MTPMAQARHVLAKDLRQLWWPFAAYLGVVAFATMNMLTLPAAASGIFGMMMVFVVMAGMFVVAMSVQADSPTRVDAFWATRPVAPWAVLLEKLLAATLIVLGLALVGQFIALRALDVPAATIPRMLAESARQYALWLLIALVVAALTEDLRSFVVALVAIPVVLLIIATAVFSDFNKVPLSNLPPLVLGSVALIGGASLLAILYRTRSSRKGLWLVALIVVACAFASAVDAPRAMPPAPLQDISSLPTPALTVRIMDLGQIATRREITLALDVDPSSAAARWSLVDPMLIAHLRSGNELRIPLGGGILDLHSAPPSLDRGIKWIVPPLAPSSQSKLAISLDDSRRAALADGIASLELTGRISVLEPRLVAEYPLEPGRRFAHDGTRIAIKRWSYSSGQANLILQEASVRDKSRPAMNVTYLGGSPNREFALINDGRGEAIALGPRTTSGSGPSLVLPGTDIDDIRVQYELPWNRGARPLDVDDDWFRSARLAQIDWVRRGNSPFRISVQSP